MYGAFITSLPSLKRQSGGCSRSTRMGYRHPRATRGLRQGSPLLCARSILARLASCPFVSLLDERFRVPCLNAKRARWGSGGGGARTPRCSSAKLVADESFPAARRNSEICARPNARVSPFLRYDIQLCHRASTSVFARIKWFRLWTQVISCIIQAPRPHRWAETNQVFFSEIKNS